jgi:hypothetical protein
MSLDDPAVIVSVDTHIGPRLVEDLRPYCPAKLFDDFDRFGAVNDLSGSAGAILCDHPNLRIHGHHESSARLSDYDHVGVGAGGSDADGRRVRHLQPMVGRLRV